MVAASQKCHRFAKNQLSPGAIAVHDGQPGLFQNHLRQADKQSDADTQYDKGCGSAGHPATRLNQASQHVK